MVLRLAARMMAGMMCFWPATSCSIGRYTSTSSNTMRRLQASGLHGFVLIDGFCQASREERRERQGLPSIRLMLSQASARPGHIDLEQAMDHGFVLDGTKCGRHPSP